MRNAKSALERKDYRRALIEFEIASQNMPKDAEPVYQMGLIYQHAGAAKQAVEAFDKAIKLNPKHQGTLFELAVVKLASDKPELWQEAKQTLSAMPASPQAGDTEVLAERALAEAKLGDQDQASKLMLAALDKKPSEMRPAVMLISFYQAKGNADKAKQIAREVADHLANSAEAATLQAEVSFSMHDFDDTDAQLSRALGLKHDYFPALSLRLRRELMGRDLIAAEQTTQEMSKSPEKQTWGAYARLLFAEHKIDQGIAEYNRVLQQHGDDSELRNDYTGLLLTSHRDKEAAAIIEGTLRKDPKDKAALLGRAIVEIDAGKLDEAAKDVKTLRDMKAISGQLNYQESRIFAARGQTVRQGDLLVEALRYAPRLLQARLELANLLLESGQGKTALATLDQAAPGEKQTPNFIYVRTMALIEAGNMEEARKNVDAELAVSRSPQFLYQDSVLRLKSNDVAGARQSLDSAHQLAPGDARILRLLGAVMTQQKEGKSFVALARDCVAKNPGSAALQVVLGDALLKQGDLPGAREAFLAAKGAGDPIYSDNVLAELDVRAGALDQARDRLLKLVQTHDNANAHMTLADIETRKGASSDVIAAQYLKALDLDPGNVLAMNNLANILASDPSKYGDALFWAQKAVGLQPASPFVQDTIGWIYFKQAKYDEALRYLDKSLRILDRPLAHYHLAGALFKSGDPTRARREYELALKQDPKNEARSAVSPLFEHQ